MKITTKSYTWQGKLIKRPKTDYIILHHAAAKTCSPDDIHRIHLSNGFIGIGYHFFVRKNGTVYEGRPINTTGAHAEGYNSVSIGVCFEGNFEKELMSDVQISAANELISYLKSLFPCAEVKGHLDFNATVCPGKNFPLAQIIGIREITDASSVVEELTKRGIITNKALWLKKCADDQNAYHLARKICNMTKKAPDRNPKLESVNDIVWELSHRGIITDKPLWLGLMEKDKDLYWLGYKGANMTR